MLRWFAPLALLLVFAAPAWAEVGTCLRTDGVWVAPFTDAVDPACGEGCGADDDFGACTPEGLCLADPEGELPRLAMPAPSGPRCLEAWPDCEPFDPTGAYSQSQSVARVQRAFALRPPRLGSLPGAGAPRTRHAPLHRTEPPETPPPRPA